MGHQESVARQFEELWETDAVLPKIWDTWVLPQGGGLFQLDRMDEDNPHVVTNIDNKEFPCLCEPIAFKKLAVLLLTSTLRRHIAANILRTISLTSSRRRSSSKYASIPAETISGVTSILE